MLKLFDIFWFNLKGSIFFTQKKNTKMHLRGILDPSLASRPLSRKSSERSRNAVQGGLVDIVWLGLALGWCGIGSCLDRVSNYSDLTTTEITLTGSVEEGKSLKISGKSRVVKYDSIWPDRVIFDRYMM